ncbi:ornithine cyclodeaminase [Ferroplasma acidiphilum]|jgi:alanine dehydrogenase|uniref:Ornithine cyclodeaminase n=1 Tax=Ferroplasma acidiphilum TaxID=74969 RepID=A0A1V0N640_9ARCH|nr:ornithine cyclodeaminase [Ferroplasma acidiphilum]ARD85546.1 ornithine cyclodeaminase [Ferroplasma acidiphilum]WMT52680.1 MAG: ornithine cyclodeaminase [Ferroplasma acidiphilum]
MITYIDDNDVKNNLPVKECVDELKEAFISYGKGESDSSPRDRIYGKDFVFSTMPALYEKRGIAGLKTYMYGKSGYRFFVILFSTENPGKLFAMDANVLGQIRTGAISAMVTTMLVKKKRINYTIIGSGFQSESQLNSISEYYELENAHVYSRNFEHAKKFAEKSRIKVEPVKDLSCLKESDIIASATDTEEPIFNYSMLPENYHINLIGSNVLGSREADKDVFENSGLVIEENSKQSAMESSEISDIKDRSKITTLGEFMLNPDKYRNSKSVFKCLGIGLEDLAAGYIVLKNMSLL